jgi:glutaredoxin 2
LTGKERPEIAAWADRLPPKTALLTWPRYPLLGLPEFATIAAVDHYNLRKRKAVGCGPTRVATSTIFFPISRSWID